MENRSRFENRLVYLAAALAQLRVLTPKCITLFFFVCLCTPAHAQLAGVTHISSSGLYHSCALTSSGQVKCWGWNQYGQLGDGTNTDFPAAIPVQGIGEAVTQLATGLHHTCALTSSGAVKCWGSNETGQLGDGTTTNRNLPVNVVGLNEGVLAIAAGAGFTCALTSLTEVKCWGNNTRGELGDGTSQQRLTPAAVVGLNAAVSALSVGEFHGCVLTDQHLLRCWGANSQGQLGDGTKTDRHTPVDVLGLPGPATSLS